MRGAAFTLAEVLITLGIIGIVSALTMPTLIQKYQKKITETRLRKFYSTMTNAINMAINEHGSIAVWEFPNEQNNTKQANVFLNTYIYPYIKNITSCYYGDDDKCKNVKKILGSIGGGAHQYPIFILADGSCASMTIGGASASSANIHFWYDINCTNPPNKAGRDLFQFFIILTHSNNTNSYSYNNRFLPGWNRVLHDYYNKNNDRETLKAGCRDGNAEYCSALIYVDGWQIKDDYPW